MNRFILIPDSFKGTMSSSEICGILAGCITEHVPGAEIISIPVADGGEGSVDCFLAALGGEKIELSVSGPFMKPVNGFYGLLENGGLAVIEMAACAGLPLVGAKKNPLLTSTCGVGQLIIDAAKRGVGKIIVGLGGSATNDGGCGAAHAAGVRFYDSYGRAFTPVGGNLKDIAHIDVSGKEKCLKGITFVAMCDIDNPMYGLQGASRVFAPQKGATPEMIELLDEGVYHLSEIIKRDLGRDFSSIPGTGAAGAMGAGMMAFFNAELTMGIEAVLDTVHFDALVKDSDMVITGEGKIDSQSLRGKVVVGVAQRAKKAGVPVIALVGDIGDDIARIYDEGVSAVFSINRVAVSFSKAKSRAQNDLRLTMDNLLRFFLKVGLVGH